MFNSLVFHLPIAMLPVLLFLAVLLYFDSYKVVHPRLVLLVIVAGGLLAVATSIANVRLAGWLALDATTYSRYVAPLLEEFIKGCILVFLFRTHRVGFLVDAGILGFAAGAGFAVVENLYYLGLIPDAHLGVWIVRGFGTAIMHGGVTAIFAILAYILIERAPAGSPLPFVPGWLAASGIHSLFNHFFFSPVVSTLAVLVVLPPLIYAAFRHGERSVETWLGAGFDADTELLELINSGELSGSRVGRYLLSLKEKFRGEVVADMLCYLRLHVELAMRAKGILMMRESGFEVAADPEVQASFEELKYLERSIGQTGQLAMKPFLHMSRKDLSQLYMVGR